MRPRRSVIAPALTRRIILGTKARTASRVYGTRSPRMASPRPVPTKPRRIRPSHWSSIRRLEAANWDHQADIDKAVAKAKEAREQGADVVAIAMHSVQEYLDYADSWQQSEAHELADTGEFDVIYGAGCHCAQPIERYNNTWIIYGLGNAVTVTSSIPGNEVNNQGVTARVQFAGKKGVAGSWRVSRIDWVPTANMRQGQYQWCPISDDHPDGTCWNETEDASQRQRIWNVIYSMGADQNVVREWNITAEQAGSSHR